MKRLGLLLVVVGLAGGALATANASTTASRTICHRTASAKNPYVKVPVSAKQLRAHAKHAADIVLAGGKACPRTRLTPTAGGRAFTIALTGEAESPVADPVATATATVRVRAGWSCRSRHRQRTGRLRAAPRPHDRSSRRSSRARRPSTSTSTPPSSRRARSGVS